MEQATFLSGIPRTVLAWFKTPPINALKHGSLQNYVENCGCSEDYNSNSYSIENVQSIAILDICLHNLDRNSSNLLCSGTRNLIPIDHGLCLPNYNYIGQAFFEWLN